MSGRRYWSYTQICSCLTQPKDSFDFRKISWMANWFHLQ